jgi:hypothetical protein
MLDLEDITAGYPRTLREWRTNLRRNTGRAAELGYDRRFRRLWELYFCWCEGGFLERRIGDVQVLLAKPAYRGSRVSTRLERAIAAVGRGPSGGGRPWGGQLGRRVRVGRAPSMRRNVARSMGGAPPPPVPAQHDSGEEGGDGEHR